VSDISFERIFQSPPDAHYFFGYFNTPQVSRDGTKALALRTAFIDRVPEGTDEAEVGYFDLSTGRFHDLGRTNTFNWQQGCMLQFLGPDYDSRVIFNRFNGKRFVAEIVDLVTGERRTVDSAVYAVFPDADRALTLDFARHYWCRRGYSYGNLVDEAKNRAVVPGDAISLVSLATGASRPVVTIEQMLALKPLSNMEGAVHYLEHMSINPNGSKFVFLHRWKPAAGGIHARLCVANADGTGIKILNDSGRMSHFCWADNRTLLGYGGIANPFNALRKNRTITKSLFRVLLPIYKALVKDSSKVAKALTGDSYISIDTETGAIQPIALPLRAEDGHPAMLRAGQIFITDTYARAKQDQRPSLFAYDLSNDHLTRVDQLDSIPEFDETPLRCDLHPRVSPCGAFVSVDTMDRGVRGTYVYRAYVA
jgi:hypothetical protein